MLLGCEELFFFFFNFQCYLVMQISKITIRVTESLYLKDDVPKKLTTWVDKISHKQRILYPLYYYYMTYTMCIHFFAKYTMCIHDHVTIYFTICFIIQFKLYYLIYI